MTREEHNLMLEMFERTTTEISVLYQILKSRGLLKGDDGVAFQSATRQDPEMQRAIRLQVSASYAQAAQKTGVNL